MQRGQPKRTVNTHKHALMRRWGSGQAVGDVEAETARMRVGKSIPVAPPCAGCVLGMTLYVSDLLGLFASVVNRRQRFCGVRNFAWLQDIFTTGARYGWVDYEAGAVRRACCGSGAQGPRDIGAAGFAS